MEALLLQFVSALVGGLVVYVFGVRKLSIEARNSFIEKQMSEFYSPIAGYRKRIRARSKVREKVSAAASEAWSDLCQSYTDANQPMHNHEELFAPYKKIIEYDNKQFRDELIPLYRKMLDVFTDKYWLADQDTRGFYQNFLEFVEIWERYLAESMPDDVLVKLGHTEQTVHPFYEHIETRLSELQAKMKANSFWKTQL